jgi:hypothetical protein
MGAKPAGEVPIIFTPEEFADAVRRAALDLSEFLIPLQEWLDAYTPEHSATMARLFEESFVSVSDKAV